MICVPTDNPGYEMVRSIPVMGHDEGPGHCEVRFTGCRVPKANLLGERGAGFAIAQDRLGPGASTTACGRSAPPSGPTR